MTCQKCRRLHTALPGDGRMGCWLRKGWVSGDTGPAEWALRWGGAGEEGLPVWCDKCMRGWPKGGRESKLVSSNWEDSRGATGGTMKPAGDGWYCCFNWLLDWRPAVWGWTPAWGGPLWMWRCVFFPSFTDWPFFFCCFIIPEKNKIKIRHFILCVFDYGHFEWSNLQLLTCALSFTVRAGATALWRRSSLFGGSHGFHRLLNCKTTIMCSCMSRIMHHMWKSNE